MRIEAMTAKAKAFTFISSLYLSSPWIFRGTVQIVMQEFGQFHDFGEQRPVKKNNALSFCNSFRPAGKLCRSGENPQIRLMQFYHSANKGPQVVGTNCRFRISPLGLKYGFSSRGVSPYAVYSAVASSLCWFQLKSQNLIERGNYNPFKLDRSKSIKCLYPILGTGLLQRFSVSAFLDNFYLLHRFIEQPFNFPEQLFSFSCAAMP